MPFARIRKMKNLPFSVFKRADRPYYSVSFKNEATVEYYPAISTRRKPKRRRSKPPFLGCVTGYLKSGCPSEFKT
jgi:hypothetical protein